MLKVFIFFCGLMLAHAQNHFSFGLGGFIKFDQDAINILNQQDTSVSSGAIEKLRKEFNNYIKNSHGAIVLLDYSYSFAILHVGMLGIGSHDCAVKSHALFAIGPYAGVKILIFKLSVAVIFGGTVLNIPTVNQNIWSTGIGLLGKLDALFGPVKLSVFLMSVWKKYPQRTENFLHSPIYSIGAGVSWQF